MNKKSSLYTKAGDSGETSLVGGQRLLKSDLKIQVYGELDHLNSMIGHLLSLLEKDSGEEVLTKVQNNLFNLGSLYASAPEDREKYKLKGLDGELIGLIEKDIDEMDTKLPKLQNFILPGGTNAASWAHLCRTHCRRLERLIVKYETESSDKVKDSIVFINRLSDYFFAMARFINFNKGITEKIWS